jgi:molybdopterin-biosynthesis enzyme MoeA-like protein
MELLLRAGQAWKARAAASVPGTKGTACGFSSRHQQESFMSIKGHIKEAAGYVKEEANEHGKSAKSQEKALEGRELRNEGRIEDGKAPKTGTPGTGN